MKTEVTLFKEALDEVKSLSKGYCSSYSGTVSASKHVSWVMEGDKFAKGPCVLKGDMFEEGLGTIKLEIKLKKVLEKDTYCFESVLFAFGSSYPLSADMLVALNAMYADMADRALKIERYISGKEWRGDEIEEVLPYIELPE